MQPTPATVPLEGPGRRTGQSGVLCARSAEEGGAHLHDDQLHGEDVVSRASPVRDVCELVQLRRVDFLKEVEATSKSPSAGSAIKELLTELILSVPAAKEGGARQGRKGCTAGKEGDAQQRRKGVHGQERRDAW